ncbi:MAG: helix-turn-helix transcriptional regulator [bacterium]|nr:helix-turn-helix transcriptional regulator [bacterium]
MSQKELGSETGISFQQIQKYEKGTNRIGASRLFYFAQVLGVLVQYFFDDAPMGGGGQPSFQEAKTQPCILEFHSNYEALELNRAFVQIDDIQLHKSIINIVRAIADSVTGIGLAPLFWCAPNGF